MSVDIMARGAAARDVAAAGGAEALAAFENFLRQHIPAAAARPVEAGTPLLSSGLLDSLGVLQLVTFLAEAFGVEIGEEDFSEENFATVGAVLALVERKRPVR